MNFPAKPLLNLAIAGGVLLAAWPLGQAVYGQWNQRQLAREWQQQAKQGTNKKKPIQAKAKTVRASKAPRGEAASVLMASTTTSAKRAEWPATKISIPDIQLEAYVVNGWDEATLRRGPAHDPNSGLPGEGNCIIAGHRNVYGSYFYKVDELLPGAQIHLDTPDGRYTYSARSPVVVSEMDPSLLKSLPSGATPILTLVTCTLPHSPNRIVLQADLVAE